MIVGLDISPTSTALCIDSDGKESLYVFSKLKENNKYVKLLDFVNFEFVEYEKHSDYSKNEIAKAKVYHKISKRLAEIISMHAATSRSGPVKIIIEGHSYSSQAGHIIDVSTITGMIKGQLFEQLPHADIELVSPITLKNLTAETTYGSYEVSEGVRVIRQKKILKTNHLGTKPSKYQKSDMFIAVNDYQEPTIFDNFMEQHYEVLVKMASVPKPIDDLVDAYWLKETYKKHLK